MLKVLSQQRLTASDKFFLGGQSELTLGSGGRYIHDVAAAGNACQRPVFHACDTSNFD
jgi:hypothetical protein